MTTYNTLLMLRFSSELNHRQISDILDKFNSILYVWTKWQEEQPFTLAGLEVLGFLPLGNRVYMHLDYFDPDNKILWFKVPAEFEQVYVIRFDNIYINRVKEFHKVLQEHILDRIRDNPAFALVNYTIYQEVE
jgi:hypothetical protein